MKVLIESIKDIMQAMIIEKFEHMKKLLIIDQVQLAKEKALEIRKFRITFKYYTCI